MEVLRERDGPSILLLDMFNELMSVAYEGAFDGVDERARTLGKAIGATSLFPVRNRDLPSRGTHSTPFCA